MTEAQIKHLLNKARHAVFIGEELKDDAQTKTQEEYMEIYETRVERDPMLEMSLLRAAILPVLFIYQEKWRNDNQAAEMMTGNSLTEPEEEDDWLLEVYDEIVNTDTEKEWEQFITRFLP